MIEQCKSPNKNNKTIPIIAPTQVLKIKLKRNYQYAHRKVLCLDLDQTLIHSVDIPSLCSNRVRQELHQKFPFKLDKKNDRCNRYYAIREHVFEFLQQMSALYYIVIFTAATQQYADLIIDHIDPTKKLIKHCLYRQHCFCSKQGLPLIKDLRILNRDLSQIILVDNCICCYWFQLDNGIPIVPFNGEQDHELLNLSHFLRKIANLKDIRQVLRRLFKMRRCKRYIDSADFIRKNLLINSKYELNFNDSNNTNNNDNESNNSNSSIWQDRSSQISQSSEIISTSSLSSCDKFNYNLRKI